MTAARGWRVGATVAYALGNLTSYLVPPMMAGAMAQHGASAAQAGLLPLVEGLVGGLLSMALGARPPRWPVRRLAVLGALLFIGANAASAAAPSFQALLAWRVAAGVANAVLVFVAVSLVAAGSPQPDRSFASLNVWASLSGAALLAALPSVLGADRQGLGYLSAAAVVAALLLPLLGFVPAARPGAAHGGAMSLGPTAALRRHRGTLLLLMLVLSACSIQSFSVFVFSTGLGQAIGLSEAQVNTTLGFATLCAVLGPFSAAWAARRHGRWGPCVAVLVLFTLCNAVLTLTDAPGLFRAGLVVNLFAAYFFLPMMLAWSAALDPSGRSSNLLIGAFIAVNAVTPAAVGAWIDRAGLSVMHPLVLGTGLVALLWLLVLKRVAVTKAGDAMWGPGS